MHMDQITRTVPNSQVIAHVHVLLTLYAVSRQCSDGTSYFTVGLSVYPRIL